MNPCRVIDMNEFHVGPSIPHNMDRGPFLLNNGKVTVEDFTITDRPTEPLAHINTYGEEHRLVDYSSHRSSSPEQPETAFNLNVLIGSNTMRRGKTPQRTSNSRFNARPLEPSIPITPVVEVGSIDFNRLRLGMDRVYNSPTDANTSQSNVQFSLKIPTQHRCCQPSPPRSVTPATRLSSPAAAAVAAAAAPSRLEVRCSALRCRSGSKHVLFTKGMSMRKFRMTARIHSEQETIPAVPVTAVAAPVTYSTPVCDMPALTPMHASSISSLLLENIDEKKDASPTTSATPMTSEALCCRYAPSQA